MGNQSENLVYDIFPEKLDVRDSQNKKNSYSFKDVKTTETRKTPKNAKHKSYIPFITLGYEPELPSSP